MGFPDPDCEWCHGEGGWLRGGCGAELFGLSSCSPRSEMTLRQLMRAMIRGWKRGWLAASQVPIHVREDHDGLWGDCSICDPPPRRSDDLV